MAIGDMLRDLMWPAGREAGVQGDQSERALDLVSLAMAAGVAAIALLALGQPGLGAATRTFTTAVLAAIVAAGGGAVVGLLFGMPASAGSTIVATPPPAGGTESAADPAQPAGDWYRDNTALERLSDWLTTAIVALTIANFRDLMAIAGDVSAAVGAAMALSPPPSAAARGVAGGVVLGAYAILGFLGAYLWSRRYLRTILSTGVREAREIERLADAAKVAAARDANGVQAAPRTDEATAQATAAVEEVSNTTATESARAGGHEFARPVAPGPIADDPWKGQFGGQSRIADVVLNAVVTALTTSKGQFSVELRIGSYNVSTMNKLRHVPIRLYLHPSFPDPIRMLDLGDRGVLILPLIAYGAFTVGVQFDDDTRLELDLARLPGAPAEFRLN